MAEKDRKATSEQQVGFGAGQQGTYPDVVSQQAADLLITILQQVQQRIVSTPPPPPPPSQAERNAGFAAAAFRMIENGLALAPPFRVDRISQLEGPREGNTPVTIYGLNFLPDAKVLFGGNVASGVSVVTSTEIQARTPAGSPGRVDVVVVTSFGGEARLTPGYLYT